MQGLKVIDGREMTKQASEPSRGVTLILFAGHAAVPPVVVPIIVNTPDGRQVELKVLNEKIHSPCGR